MVEAFPAGVTLRQQISNVKLTRQKYEKNL
jgi:hypothetical protein